MSLITSFDPWKNNLCSCKPKYSLSPYTGCSHGCLYCYASSYIRDFSNPREKKDFFKRLEKEIPKIPEKSCLSIANSSDPYQPLEENLVLMPRTLEMIQNHNLRLIITTKSSLILRDINILKKIPNLTICFSFSTLDSKLAKRLEPDAPSPKQRLEAIEKLASHIPIAIRLDPLIYPLTTENLETTIRTFKNYGAKQIITSTYKQKGDNFKRMITEFCEYKKFWEKVYLVKGEKKNGSIYLEKILRKELIESVRSIALKEGLLFSSCREGFSSLNVGECDGTSLLKD